MKTDTIIKIYDKELLSKLEDIIKVDSTIIINNVDWIIIDSIDDTIWITWNFLDTTWDGFIYRKDQYYLIYWLSQEINKEKFILRYPIFKDYIK